MWSFVYVSISKKIVYFSFPWNWNENKRKWEQKRINLFGVKTSYNNNVKILKCIFHYYIEDLIIIWNIFDYKPIYL